MICDKTEVLLHALIDGELDAGHAHEVEVHSAGCPRCAAQLRAYRALRENLQEQNLYFTAPASLRRSLERNLPSPKAITSRRSLLKGFAFGSIMSAAAAASITMVILRQDRDSRILGEAISAHLRSLQTDHLTDVLSTDQHTVKPWFNGRIDIAPPVVDLTGQGFTLMGGRLDYIDGKKVAAIVYRRRVHVINLFVGQELRSTPLPSAHQTVQGFNVLRWSDPGIDLMAISDLNRDELEEFKIKFEAGAKAARED
jgi:anti-sigma factor RsiW